MMDDDSLLIPFGPKKPMNIDLDEDYDGLPIFVKEVEESFDFNYEGPSIFNKEIGRIYGFG